MGKGDVLELIYWSDAVVSRVLSCRGGVQELEVILINGEEPKTVKGPESSRAMQASDRAILYTELMPPVKPGDRVVLNTTAVQLGLGSGGVHFAHHVVKRSEEAACSKEGTAEEASGHIMKLRYTPQQVAVLAVEEAASPHHELFCGRPRLDGMPVLIGELHSMLPIAVAWLMAERERSASSTKGVASGAPHTSSDRLRLAYVMTDGGALPLAYSRHAAELTACGWLSGTVTYGHAYGGSLEAVNKFTALLAARHVHRADITIATMGPGIVGTGTRLGHTATETAELVHAAHLLGGRPVLMPRISFADARERHRGLSDHTLTALSDLCLVPVTV
ncbi:MAG: hypothetical protein K0Q81_217, partial [Paenibacillus sp.]|nr:hypothetical protein [Paenibacillus sp.]